MTDSMKYGLAQKDVDNLISTLKQFTAVEAAYLYGSRVKGNFKPSSDIDIALKGSNLNIKELTSILIKLDDLLLPYQFDVSIYHHIDNPELLDHISRIGIDLYRKDKSAIDI